MTPVQAEQRLRQLAREIDYLENAMRSLTWDMRVNLPRMAGEYRGETIGFLSDQVFRRKTAPELDEVLAVLEQAPPEDSILAAMVRKFRHEHDYLLEVPAELNAAYAAHKLRCELVWQEARANNDYPLLRPWLEQEFAYLRQIAAAHGFAEDPLSGLMSAGDPGSSREKTDLLFDELKAFALPFLDRLRGAAFQPPALALGGEYPVARQRELCLTLLSAVGFDFDRGRMDESAHPYTTANDPYDIRFTTRYSPSSFLPALFSCLHEGGHGLHAQNALPALRRTTLENAPYDALCESQSRFLENMLGKGLPFWEYCLPLAQQHFPQLQELRPQPFYESLNRLCFSANRMQADELSYNLHILIRYELEKLLLDGDLSFAELPEAWDQKYQDYLGLRPASDAEGVLQDMHWSSGYIGYFQSYVMGNLYAAHFHRAMRKALPDLDDRLRRGEFTAVVGWLRENIQQYGGMYSPAQLLQRIDGEELSAQHYLDYLTEKYSAIYRL